MSGPFVIAKFQKNSKEAVYVAVSEYRQASYIDLRTYADYDGGGLRPTRKGVSLRIGLLPELRAALDRADVEARRFGLLKDEEIVT